MRLPVLLSVPLKELRDIKAYTHSREGQVLTDGVWMGGIMGIVLAIVVIKLGILNV
jgi:hypothetical protein